MIDLLFLAALLCGCVGAFTGNRTAMALLAGTALTSIATALSLPFHPLAWMAVDFAVIIAILRRGWTDCDGIVISLYVALWPLYFVEGQRAADASALVSAAQFLMTWPLAALIQGRGHSLGRRDVPPWLRMVAHHA